MDLLSTAEMEKIFQRWEKSNPNPTSELDYTNPFTLLVAVVLSAQATDKSVNIATKKLFQLVDTPEKMVQLGEKALIEYIKTIGLYKNKAKHVIALSQKLIEDFNSIVPSSREELMTLPGVGRKTANVVLNVIFKQPTMPVDTHLLRVCPKIGLAEGTTPEQIEQSLLQRIPEKYLYNAHHWILLHGRYVCTAKNPNCQDCIIRDICLHNYFAEYDWKKMLTMNPMGEYDTQKYHQVLEPDFPDFLNKYIQLPMLQRLKGIGLLCGTDWTKLYKNRFYYSRLDHSVGVALIIWHFTHDKAQTIAGLLHDVSTSVFSHVSDFRKGDALTQTITEAENESIIHSNNELKKLLESDNLTIEQIEDYHKYPIADNEIPQLSADRLEYMFPSGMALDGTWDLPSIERAYNDIEVLTNENGEPELGFKTLDIAVDYCRRFCMIGHILQLNENKLTLHLLGQIMNLAVETNLLTEQDFMLLSEKEILEKLEAGLKKSESSPKVLQLDNLYKTFRNMTKIEHTTSALSETEYFSVSLRVKQRYINPLVKNLGRVKDNSPLAAKIIKDFLTYEDSKYGCVKLINDL